MALGKGLCRYKARRVRRPRPTILRMTKFRPFLTAGNISRPFSGIIALGALLLGAGCNSNTNADKEESIDFTSAPTHAKVNIDGNSVGTTPMSAVLGKGPDTHLTFSKAGFATQEVYVHTVNGRLTPSPVDVKLRLDLLPEKPGQDRAADLQHGLELVKQLIASGTLAAEDEAEAEEQVREFYK